MLPTFQQIEALHKRLAPTKAAFDLVFTHCIIVSEIADALLANGNNSDIDAELVRAGCLLHDIGVYALYENGVLDRGRYITHGTEGYKILKAEGFDEAICRIASHHTGVGLTREDIAAQNLPLPDEDLLAETKEERLVMYADKFHSKAPQFNTFESYTKTVSKFGAGKASQFASLANEFGIPALDDLSAKYGHPIV
jgi:uncharacterized protein